MIKIVLIRNVSPNNYGGIKKHCIELSLLFGEDKDISILPIVDIPSSYIPIIKKSMFRFSALYKYLKETNYDIIHIHGFASLDVIQCFIVAKYLKKKIVFSPHYHPFKYLQRPLLGKLFFYGCLRHFLHLASAIVTITKNDTIFFQNYHKFVYKIPHQFEPICNPNKHFISKKANMVLFVGRNDKNKGVSYLYHLHPKYEVHLVTKGVVDRNDFVVHSNISNEELDSLYNRASLVVVPSRYEAFSYVVLEAFARGTPVVMSKTVMIADYLIGFQGYSTFDFGDEKSFIQAVDKTIGTSVDTDAILLQFEKKEVKASYKNMYINIMKGQDVL